MPTPIKDDLDAIVGRIGAILPEALVYLFGSHATGDQRDDSDIDLCVVVPEFREGQLETMFSIRKAIRGATKRPIDVLAFRKDDFEDRARLRSTIQHVITHRGVLLNG